MTEIRALAIPEVKLITPRRFGDARGYFVETYHLGRLTEAGIATVFVQDNQSLSRDVGTVRGLHCQLAPYAQAKLVRCIRGAIWDVAVDARSGSPTYGQHVAAELSAENGAQLLVPVGFLHGFCTLEADTEVAYKCSGFYDHAAERAVRWDDPDLALPWPMTTDAVLSDKDRAAPPFSAAAGWFAYS